MWGWWIEGDRILYLATTFMKTGYYIMKMDTQRYPSYPLRPTGPFFSFTNPLCFNAAES